MNVPYVKRYNKEGDLLNPIEYRYVSPFPNRRMRRTKMTPKRGGKLLITPFGRGKYVKFRTSLQLVKGKTILHYKEV